MENKLISMTAFTIKECENYFKGFIDLTEYQRRTDTFAKFLSQPLKLEMFVPVGENGKVLTEPIYPSHTGVDEFYKVHKPLSDAYKEAMDKVLFEGFEWIPVMKQVVCKKPGCVIDQMIIDRGKHIIEDLLPYNLILNPTALKQIYG